MAGDTAFLVMEYLQGITWRGQLTRIGMFRPAPLRPRWIRC
jgi:hypothetical protein